MENQSLTRGALAYFATERTRFDTTDDTKIRPGLAPGLLLVRTCSIGPSLVTLAVWPGSKLSRTATTPRTEKVQLDLSRRLGRRRLLLGPVVAGSSNNLPISSVEDHRPDCHRLSRTEEPHLCDGVPSPRILLFHGLGHPPHRNLYRVSPLSDRTRIPPASGREGLPRCLGWYLRGQHRTRQQYSRDLKCCAGRTCHVCLPSVSAVLSSARGPALAPGLFLVGYLLEQVAWGDL